MFNGVRQHLPLSAKSDPSSAKLLIHSLKLENAGVYQCFAENRAGVASDAVLVSVVPGVRERGDEDVDDELDKEVREHHHHGRKRGWRRKGEEKVKPSAPSVIQKSRDSVSISWTMETNTTEKVAFFKVQYRFSNQGLTSLQSFPLISAYARPDMIYTLFPDSVADFKIHFRNN